MSLDQDINKVLKTMHGRQATDKGSPGEYAALKICEEFYNKYGGILIWSYSYQVDKDEPGNIYMDRNNGNRLYIENLGSSTEIDILYVSPTKVFPIEVKAYKSKKISLFNDRIDGVFKNEKSPVHQNEMHCRHLYSFLYRALPEGDTRYIVPIVVFVDEAEIEDNREDWQRDYILVRTLNSLHETLEDYMYPLDYKLDLTLVNNLLHEKLVKAEVFMPVRY